MKQRLRRLMRVGLLAVLLGLALGLVANAIVFHASRGLRFSSIEATPARYTAIVLGARVYDNGEPSPPLEDRLGCAQQLYRAGKIERILVSGDHGAHSYDEVNIMGRWLIARGVAEADVFYDHAGFRTLDTMERAAHVFQVRDAVICTQAFHLPRALFLAQRAGIDAVGHEADRRPDAAYTANQIREFLARTKAVLDSYILRTAPRHLGEPIPITGSPKSSRG